MINFVDPIQTRREHEALMHDVNKEARLLALTTVCR